MQTKYDLYVIRQLINFANYLCKRYKFEGIDFRKFNEHFQNSLVKELDFKSEVVNAERTR
jgi:predicted unusual protein kinase regulating ubiquinone biosynthesis (AarF/ABC1/UbiB family)